MTIAIFHTFVHLLAESLPLFVLGAALGALLEVWLKPEWVERWMNRPHHSVVAATVIGAVLPGCAVSTIPLAQSLQRRGAAVGTLTAFIMIAPILSPHTIVLTATLVSVPMAIGRVVLSFAVSLVLGELLNALPLQRRATIPLQEEEPGPICCETKSSRVAPDKESSQSICDADFDLANQSIAKRFLKKFWTTFRDLAPYLIIGLLVAAVLSALIPVEVIQKYLRGDWTAYLFAVIIGIPLYVCDGGEIPLTRALLDIGVGAGPAFCFMLASVGTCFPTIAMATRIIGWRATIIYLIAWLALAVGGGLLMSLFL